jgi:F0F1-type ATP synthase assembly protein I
VQDVKQFPMKLSYAIAFKIVSTSIGGLLVGIGVGALTLVDNFATTADQIRAGYYLGFGTILFGAIIFVYEMLTIHKIIDNIRKSQTSIE